ncbi:MAG: UDP-2,3-diacylglucosamine diphosphatase [Flavobacterium sp.]|uniref:UDP-2,3-diacylglucosamine diphosphatase n=1 Tax=Flavobacterium sp. TaxID=239 RepID=UPI0011F5BA2A|nr:UDP-2,3-diacylglucosamine diphosphatase [Flavobacterium sp.]RZJ67299.1 MAG: UDP-2,3-diacylglucosamine diphosphatase [Flavobacterium sp.]
MKKRKVELLVLSDVHLGTYGCHAKELLHYLNSIKPKTLVLNGDIIDIWQFRKSYFPKSHLKVISKIIDFASKGTKVFYITGNHDEMLRKFSDTKMGNFSILDKLVLDLDGSKAWIFHGDVFDASVQHSKWIAKLGGIGYDYLILVNRFVNWCLHKIGKEPYSFSKKIKGSVKKAVKFISDFEKTATELAIEKGYDYVVCGHIHEPKITDVENRHGKTTYLNSGDWIENLTALEYNKKRWKLYRYADNKPEVDEELFEMENMLSQADLTGMLFSRKRLAHRQN